MPNVEVEKRILEAQFQNKDFNKNIRKSQKTLEDFKKSMNFDDAVQQMQNVTDQGTPMSKMFTDLSHNVKRLADEFTGIGHLSTYIAQRVKSAWQGALRDVEQFSKSLTTAQIGVGSDKYDKLLKSVQTIMNATGDAEEDVYSVMRTLNEYTDQTSYNFSDMANNIGKFTTAGVSLKDAELEMEGIANWAALAGQGVNEAQRAMYNISQAMSAGYMQLMDYRSIQNANMDIRKFREEAIRAAVAVGSLTEKNGKFYTKSENGAKEVEVTMDNFAQTLQYKWFNKEAMEAVFKTFGDNTQGIGEEAYKAAQRCVTFSDALNAIKDMLSTGWMQTYQHIFGKLSDAMALFSGMCDKASEMLGKFSEMRNKILEGWSGKGRASLWGALVGEIEPPDGGTLFKGAYGLLDVMKDISDKIFSAFWSFVRRFVNPDNLDWFDESEENKFAFLSGKLVNLTEAVQKFTNSVGHFLNDVPEGETESRMDRVQHVIESIFAAISLVGHIIAEVGKFAGSIISQFEPAFKAIGIFIGYLAQLLTGGIATEMKQNGLGTFLQSIATVLRPFTTAINIAVQSLVKFVIESGLMQKVAAVFRKIAEVLPVLIANLVKFGASIVKSIKNSKLFNKFWTNITSVFNSKNIKDLYTKTKEHFTKLIQSFPKTFEELKQNLSNFVGKLGPFVSDFFDKIFKMIVPEQAGRSGKSDLKKTVVNMILPEDSNGMDLLTRIKNGLTNFFQPVRDWLHTFFTETIPGFLNGDLINSIKGFFDGTTLMGLLEKYTEFQKWASIGKWGTGIASMGLGIRKLGVGIKKIGKGMKALAHSFSFGKLTDVFENFGSDILKIAAAVGILTLAASKLASMPIDELKKAGITIAAMLGGLILAGAAAKHLTGGGTGILGLALGVAVLVKTLEWIFYMPAEVFENAGLKLGLLMYGLAGAMNIATGGPFMGGSRSLKGVIGFAIGVTILLIPLKVLSNELKQKGQNIDEAMIRLEAIMFSVAAVGAIMGAMKFSGFKGMIGFAAAIVILMIPLQMLSKMFATDPVGLGAALAALAGIMLGIGLLASAAGNKEIGKLSGLVAAIAALAVVGWLIGQMKWEQVLTGFLPIIALIAVMSLFCSQASKMTPEQMQSVTKIFTIFAVVVGVLAGVIALISWLKVDPALMAIFFGGIILTLVMTGVMIKMAAKTDAKAIGKVALVMGLLAVVVAVAGAALIGMAQFGVDWGLVAAFMVGLSLMMAAMALVIPKLAALDPVAAVKGIGLMALGIVAVMGAVSLMLPVLMGAVGDSLMMLGAKLKNFSGLLSKFFKDMDTIGEGSVTNAKKVFDGLVEIIKKFAGIGSHNADIDNVLSQLNKLGTGLDLFFVNEKSYPSPENSVSIKLLNKFVEMAPSLGTISFGNLPNELLRLGVGIMLFNSATKDITSSEPPALALITSIVSTASGQEGKIPSTLAEDMMYLGVSLGLFDYAVSGVKTDSPGISLMSSIFGLFKDGAPTIPKNLDLQIMDLGEGLGAFGTATTDVTNSNPPALGLMQGLFGQASNIETFTKLPLTELSGRMATLGGAMSLYAKGAKEASGLEPGEIPDMTDSVEILKAICASITGEDGSPKFEIPENLPTETELGVFAAQLSALGDALAKYATAANTFKGGSATRSIKLLTLLGTMGGYLNKDNLESTKAFDDAGVSSEGQEGTGTPLGRFAIDIRALGHALGAFADATKDKTFDSGYGALAHLATINGFVTTSALAFTTAFTGANVSGNGQEGTGTPLGKFALDIGALGVALGEFGDLTGNKKFDNGYGALEKLAGINTHLTADSLLFTSVFTDKNLSSDGSRSKTGTPLGNFAIDIGGLATALDSFGALTADKTFDNGFGALDKFQEINSKLVWDNLGFLTFFTSNSLSGNGSTGSNTPLGKFATDIGQLGHAMASFATNITTDDGKAIKYDDALHALNSFAAINAMIPKAGGFAQWFTGSEAQAFRDLSGSITGIGEALSTFNAALVGVDDGASKFDYETAMNGLKAVEEFLNVMVQLRRVMVQEEAGGGQYIGFTRVATEMIDLTTVLNKEITGSDGEVSSIGKEIALFAKSISTAFGDMEGINPTAVTIFSEIAAGVRSLAEANNMSEDFAYPGEMISEGIRQGILSGKSNVINAVIEVVTAAVDAGNKALEVASPSKVFAEMGMYMDLGLVKGMNDNKDEVEDATGGIAGLAIETATTLMSLITQAMEENADLQPRITPILDLSNVSRASSRIGGMFGSPIGLNLASAVDRANAATSSSGAIEVVVQNQPDLTSINASLQSLQTQMDNLGVAISNMRLVLNTGVVAGGVTDDVDLNLGRKNLYASRRN